MAQQSSHQQQQQQRKIAIAVDLSDESAYAVRWAVANYLRPGDSVILLHVRPTSVLYGADWGVLDHAVSFDDEESQQKMEDDFDAFTSAKSSDIAKPIVDAKFPHKIHIVKDHDMKERLCLEVERLGASALIMGSRGFGASKPPPSRKGRLGSVSDYCVQHCVCPVVVVRFPEDSDDATTHSSGRRSLADRKRSTSLERSADANNNTVFDQRKNSKNNNNNDNNKSAAAAEGAKTAPDELVPAVTHTDDVHPHPAGTKKV